MILYPRAKPVQIRILYNNKEHYSIDTIRQDFDYREIIKLLRNSQFFKWLEQQKEPQLQKDLAVLFNDDKTRENPSFIDLLYPFFTDVITREDITIPQVYKKFENHKKYRRIAGQLLLHEYENNPQSKDVHKVLRSLDVSTLQELGIVEWEMLRLNYYLSKNRDHEAKQFITAKFPWLKYASLEVLFYSKHPDHDNKEDLPKILTFWKENGFEQRLDEYLNKHSDFLSNHPLLSSFVPNYDYHARFAKHSSEEINMVETFIEQVKVGKLNISAKKEEEIRKKFPHLKLIINALEEFNRKSIALKGGLPFKSLPLKNIYDKLMINIIKRHQREIVTPVASTEPYLDYWINIRRLYDAKNSFNAVLDAYFYSEKKFKELHADFPYING